MKNKLKKIKCIAMDIDGVLTDGKIIISSSLEELKNFNVQDGMGIYLATKSGFIISFISGKTSNIIAERAKELDVKEIYQGVKSKGDVIRKLKEKYKLQKDEICFIGDDVNDIDVKDEVGILFAVKNACLDLKEIAHYITKKQGGEGAVREIIEMILKAQNKWKF